MPKLLKVRYRDVKGEVNEIDLPSDLIEHITDKDQRDDIVSDYLDDLGIESRWFRVIYHADEN